MLPSARACATLIASSKISACGYGKATSFEGSDALRFAGVKVLAVGGGIREGNFGARRVLSGLFADRAERKISELQPKLFHVEQLC